MLSSQVDSTLGCSHFSSGFTSMSNGSLEKGREGVRKRSAREEEGWEGRMEDRYIPMLGKYTRDIYQNINNRQ